MKLELTPRLALLASWVPPGARLIDVGTDHGYLPAWLIQNGRIEEALASDLRPGPLSRAEDTARRCGVEGKMRLRLCPGLSAIRPEEGDTIAIAGMGGENIAMILSAAPWTADGQHTLLLQPQSRSEVLRRFLQDRGYRILREQLVRDRGILYPVLEARGGLSGKRSSVLLSVLSKRELPVLEEAVHAIDPQCFMVVSPVAQVSGRGFSLDKRPEERGAADSNEQG